MAPVSSKTTTCSTGLLITGYLGKRWNGGSPDGQCVPRTIIMSTQLLISQGAPVLSWTWDSFRITKMKIWCAGSSNLLSSLTRHVSRNMLYLSTHSSLPCRFEIAEKRQLPQSTSHMSIYANVMTQGAILLVYLLETTMHVTVVKCRTQKFNKCRI